MKKILLILCGLCVSSASAQTTLRFAHFDPSQGLVSLYLEQDGFNRTVDVPLSALGKEQQDGVNAALDWLASALPAGFSTLDRVVLEPGGEIEIRGERERTLNAAVSGSGPKGSRTVIISGGDSPKRVRAGLLAIWDALEGGQNP